MPRKAPSVVQESRITLGNFERDEFKQTLDAVQRQMKVNTIVRGVQGVTTVAAVVGVGYLGFLSIGMIAKAFGYAGDLVEEVKDTASNIIYGQEEYVTGEYKDDGTPNNIKNPANDIPIIGGLFGAGMKIGAGLRFDPFGRIEEVFGDEFGRNLNLGGGN